MTDKKKRGAPPKPDGYEYKHKRAVSLTDRQFEDAKRIFGGLTQAIEYALKNGKWVEQQLADIKPKSK